jgi:hypothetical protein
MSTVPPALRTWFQIHCAVDLVFAAPLFFAPRAFLGLLGWTEVDPVTARLVAAALVGIGVESWLARDAPVASFRTMLQLKCLWSGVATVGLVWSALTGAPVMTWGFVVVFAGFHGLWQVWRVRVGRPISGQGLHA